MLIRVGVAAAMALAASTVVFAGQAAAQNGCASNQPKWNYVCLPSVANVSLGYCLKEGRLWNEHGECVARWDNDRYDYWIPQP
ncbi:hypothetical protein ACFYV7_12185 [Nocardia suismassiliense]|uniref:Uncharacterized protein n=1 Tax=Nocardia suismassiliense TaxID=2077092 RepID=A0ABW6QR63_9NOCA